MDQTQYRQMISDLMDFLSGHSDEIVVRLQNDMEKAAEELRFEKAAAVRDQLKAIQSIIERQKIVFASDYKDSDVLAMARNNGEACVQIFFIRNGKLIGREYFILEGTEDDIILEARDRIMMPTPSQTVSIIGSVKNPSTVVYRPSLGLDDYLRQAGGLTEDANKKEMYVMRANGTTDSAYLAVKDLRSGDTIVVPQKIEARTPQLALWQTVASIIGSVALTAAGIAVVGR